MFDTPQEMAAESEVGQQSLVEFAQATLDRLSQPREKRRGTEPVDERARVAYWLRQTDLGASSTYGKACTKYDTALEALNGGKPEDVQDATAVTVRYIYRNAMQTMAMLMPDMQTFRWRKLKSLEELNRRRLPTDPDANIEHDPWAQLAESANALVPRRLNEIDAQLMIEAWVQEGVHFPAAFLKLFYHREYGADPLSRHRDEDDGDRDARMRELLHLMEEGRITDESAEYHELRGYIEQQQDTKNVQVLSSGLSLEVVNFKSLRIDPKITRYCDFYKADWIRHTVLMRGGDLLAKVDHLHVDDLSGAQGYAATGAKLSDGELEAIEKHTGKGTADYYSDQYYEVHELWSRREKRVYVFVEGIPYFLRNYTPTKMPERWYPFVPLVLNPQSNEFYGMSDTELQEKIQESMNRKRTQADDARRADQPRFVYDSASIDEDTARRISQLKPWEGLGLNLGGRDIRQSLMELKAGNFNPNHYDTTADRGELREMAAMPEQALGSTGNADFSSEVHAAQAGMNVAVQARKFKVVKALSILYDMAIEYLLMEETPEDVKDELGEEAYWPVYMSDTEVEAFERDLAQVRGGIQGMVEAGAQMGMASPEEIGDPAQIADEVEAQIRRQTFGEFMRPVTKRDIHRRLELKLDVDMSEEEHRDSLSRTLLKLWEIAQASGLVGDSEKFMMILGRVLGVEDHLQAVFSPDINLLVQQAIVALSQDPNSLTEETLQFLAEVLPELMAILPAPQEDPGVAET